MKAVIAIFALFLIGLVASDWVCTEGVPYVENECNGCFCSRGLLACTEKACPGPTYQSLYNCKVGTKSKKGCNDCVCVDQIGTVCTDLEKCD